MTGGRKRGVLETPPPPPPPDHPFFFFLKKRGVVGQPGEKTPEGRNPLERGGFFFFFSGQRGGGIFPRPGLGKDLGSGRASPPKTWRTEHDWESGTLTAETIDAGYISIILEI